MAGPQPAPGGAGQYPYENWMSSLLRRIGDAAHPAAPAIPGDSQAVLALIDNHDRWWGDEPNGPEDMLS
jgi:hypothetical protein